MPILNRAGAGNETLIGDFADIMLVLPDVDAEASATALVAATGDALDAAARHLLPFAETAALLRGLHDDPARPPIEACCTYARQDQPILTLEGVTATPLPANRGALVFALFLTIIESGGAISLNLEYLKSAMDEAAAASWLARYEALLDAMLADPDAPLARVFETAGVAMRPQLRIIGSFTAEPLAEPVEFLAQAFRLPLQLGFAPFGQVLRELLDQRAPSYAVRNGAVAVLWRLCDLVGENEGADPTADLATVLRAAERLGELAGALEAAAARFSVPLIVLRCPDTPELEAAPQWRALQARADQRLAAIGGTAMAAPSGVWFDAAAAAASVPYTDAGFAELALTLMRRVVGRLLPPRKLAVLDADETLWQGVVGEVGPQGLAIGPARRAFEERLVAAQQSGLLLAVASKNAVEDVDAALAALGDMPVRPEHLVAVQAHWRPKSETIAALAGDLGLGLELGHVHRRQPGRMRRGAGPPAAGRGAALSGARSRCGGLAGAAMGARSWRRGCRGSSPHPDVPGESRSRHGAGGKR